MAPGEGQTVDLGIIQMRVLAAGEATTGRAFTLAEFTGGEGSWTVPHIHHAMEESFYVLDGSPSFFDGSTWTEGGPGFFLYVPRGGIHGFRNEADEPTSILMLFAPGAPREHYFEGMAQLGDMTDEERREWFIANDNFFIE